MSNPCKKKPASLDAGLRSDFWRVIKRLLVHVSRDVRDDIERTIIRRLGERGVITADIKVLFRVPALASLAR